MTAPIDDYAIIGDTSTAALVSRDGSIDWLCLPRFDSEACFAALLGDHDNGHWRIAPSDEIRSIRRAYRAESLILETVYETASGAVRVIDAMPPSDGRSDVVRRVEGLRGRVRMRQDFVVRFGYGRIRPWVRRRVDDEGRQALSAVAGPDALCLRGDVLPDATDHRHAGEFTIRKGQHRDFSVTWYRSHEDLPAAYDCDDALERTDHSWRAWSGKCQYDGPYRDQVLRSVLTLKALTYEPTGGIVAAATTSLPEWPGGTRNWDYRFCWLRDAALTLTALLDCGYREEAAHWRRWLLRAVAGDPEDIQIMYGIAGERVLREWEIDWLAGYRGAAPVRIGNDAYRQFQAEIFGEVMDTLHRAREAGLSESEMYWPVQRALMGHLERVWQEPDQGIWESRGAPQAYTHSRVMTWVAFDRATKACEDFGLDGPVDRWRELREVVREEIHSKGYDEDVGSFMQFYGGTTLDAALLMLPIVGFLPATDERMAGTIRAIERHLVRDGLVYRYDTAESPDGLPPGEFPFLTCSFWLAHCYALQGRLEEAQDLLDRLMSLGNDVGLFAEEYDPQRQEMAGNTPQALSHLALIGAVLAYAHATGHSPNLQ